MDDARRPRRADRRAIARRPRPAKSVGLFGGMRVFDANPRVEAALKERGRLWHREAFAHQYPHCWRCHNPVIFLATSQWFISLDGVRLETDTTDGGIAWRQPGGPDAPRGGHRRGRSPGEMDSRVGPRPDLQHDREPARLVYFASTCLGRADSGGRLRGVRRSDRHHGAGRAGREDVRTVWRRRVVRAPDRRVHPARIDLSRLRRDPHSNGR